VLCIKRAPHSCLVSRVASLHSSSHLTSRPSVLNIWGDDDETYPDFQLSTATNFIALPANGKKDITAVPAAMATPI
jgi:hypothetical protein